MQPGDTEDIFVSKTLYFAHGVGELNKWVNGLRKISIMVKVHRSLSVRLSVFYPIQFYSILWHSKQMTCSFPTLCMYIYLCIQQKFQSMNMVSCRRKESGISDISNLLESDEHAEKISDTIDSGSSATDKSSDTDFGNQEDI